MVQKNCTGRGKKKTELDFDYFTAFRGVGACCLVVVIYKAGGTKTTQMNDRSALQCSTWDKGVYVCFLYISGTMLLRLLYSRLCFCTERLLFFFESGVSLTAV